MSRNPRTLIKFMHAAWGVVNRRVPEYSSKFSRKDFTVRQHVCMLLLKIKLKQRYRAFCDLLAVMPDIRRLLGLTKIPHWTTLDKAFLRLQNTTCAALLECEPSGYCAVDATGFDLHHSSRHYTKRCKIDIRSLKVTLLVDTQTQQIIGVHCITTRRHDARIILPLVRRHRRKLKLLCADKGYDSSLVRRSLQSWDIRPIIPHRIFHPWNRCWNARLELSLYGQRSLCETVNSVLKRKYTDKLYARVWYNQFKEMRMIAAAYNIDKQIAYILKAFLQSPKGYISL